MNYKEAMEYLARSQRFGSKPGLERIRELCRRLGDPQNSLSYIHVTGTNGKGSVCAMLYSVLSFAGVKTGLFTSPHMLRFHERFAANGTLITKEEIRVIVNEVAAAAEGMEESPTEFELMCAMSFLFFKKRKCDIVVCEVGMGGRLDSTNIIPPPLAAVITGVALDHTAVLGDTLEKIAQEKAGIIKSGCPVVCGEMPKAALDVILEKARAEKSPVILTGPGTEYAAANQRVCEGGLIFDIGQRTNLRIPLAGLYQFKNAAVAVAALDAVGLCGKRIPDIVVKRGLARVRWRGRFELFSPDPLLIFDGGHNPQGLTAAAESLAAYYPDRKFTVITGVMADKDRSEMIKIMSSFAKEVFTVEPDNPRALDAKKYAAELAAAGIPAKAFSSMEEALVTASDRDTVVVGSLYMYKQFIDSLGM